MLRRHHERPRELVLRIDAVRPGDELCSLRAHVRHRGQRLRIPPGLRHVPSWANVRKRNGAWGLPRGRVHATHVQRPRLLVRLLARWLRRHDRLRHVRHVHVRLRARRAAWELPCPAGLVVHAEDLRGPGDRVRARDQWLRRVPRLRELPGRALLRQGPLPARVHVGVKARSRSSRRRGNRRLRSASLRSARSSVSP
jgi:hypothetical protein